MLVIRPIGEKDLDGLLELIQNSGHGLTTLPKDRDILNNKITISKRSFTHRGDRPNGESYLFVMEELYTGKIVGVSGLISKIGGFEPFYFYKVVNETKVSHTLGIEKNVCSLHIERVHSGPAEICSLYLHDEFRNSQNGRFLSLSRFLFMAENEQHFEKSVIAEMRGRVNDDGHSPFWDAVGKKFMNIEFVEADLMSLKTKKFIEELLPDYPILLDLLPKEAQEVVSEVHPNTVPARRILEREGFSYKGLVGIFEPGPILEAKLEDIRAYKESKVVQIESITDDKLDDCETVIISTHGRAKFKACLGKLKINENNEEKVVIPDVVASTLKLKVDHFIRFVALRPKAS